ncbi:NAD-dependent malic enzyme [Paenibacillus chungangensis]|uniref:NAD-dependent malic enzyme n=1 Tax=Paenibacillus chungangensis TaxID=696535 RepID=A0ABW3HQW0_9BACL
MSTYTSVIIRIEMDSRRAAFADVSAAISRSGGDMIAIDLIRSHQTMTVRDVTVNMMDSKCDEVLDSIRSIEGITIVNVSDCTFLAHLGGKIEIQAKRPIRNREDLSRVYTPGVAKISRTIHEQQHKAYSLTLKRNSVAVVSDGTAVLGLGDIGPWAALPVMEGKAMLFKQLANIDAYPLCLDTKDPDEIVRIVKAVSPGFGGINLEDISSPRCFEIERRLTEELDIPVFHDDQHGTAVVAIAGLINALKVVGKRMDDVRIVVAGIGAAGVSICKMLIAAGAGEVIAVDREGALSSQHEYDNPMWSWLASRTNPSQLQGSVSDVMNGVDVFIGVSGPGALSVEDVRKMADNAIVFAMANPEPEIDPEVAEPYVKVLATGRSDYPNQINNVLCFPGMFRGALDCRAKLINEEMKLAAASAIAGVIPEEEVNEHYIIPSIFNEVVVERVRQAVVEAAIQTGVHNRIPRDLQDGMRTAELAVSGAFEGKGV